MGHIKLNFAGFVFGILMVSVTMLLIHVPPHINQAIDINHNIFTSIVLSILVFVATYNLITLEGVIDSYKKEINDRDRTIKELENLLFKKDSLE